MNLIFGFLLLIIQVILIFGTGIVIYPEMYFLPWLVHKGLIPYRDFFDHHGFFLYYLLAPLTFDKSFLLLKFAYLFIQSVNLLLVLLILKKITNKIGYFTGGALYVLINFFVMENIIWYEAYIVTLYLFVYLLLIVKKFKYKPHLLGFLIALCSFIKPVAAIILLPVLIFNKNLRIILFFLLSWIAVLIYFLSKGSLIQFLEYNFTYNWFINKELVFSYSYWPKYTFFVIIISVITFYISSKSKKIKVFFLPVTFFLCSLIFLQSTYFSAHFLPLSIFFTVMVACAIKYNRSINKYLYLGLVLIFVIYLLKIDIQQYLKFNSPQRIPWLEDKKINSVINGLQKLNIGDKKIYIFDNHPEIYMALNQLPPTYFPVKFLVDNKYFYNYEERIIDELKNNNVFYVIFPEEISWEYKDLKKIEKYIHEKYALLKNFEGYQLLARP
ncbi:hypothetical protein A2W14_02285 [Candidatus Gottesmanbacteria bacterium RBG_16_37_8]|uniref:Glycosyltransferase RgtA/B/C/D-like domain-containing protein n=1 Tax=Candidatus Gottesmanbacteria bacterium RBG_16_37_8 TaxID=1798371 RepID=A0A1F5YRN8_9BACT|nr:MAG: hypothetical protein A2W14_02285 [Candidatus Gottesmanbacteria bacterium RBG_16_37_8]